MRCWSVSTPFIATSTTYSGVSTKRNRPNFVRGFFTKPVSTKAGHMHDVLTPSLPCSFNSNLKQSISPTTACLLELQQRKSLDNHTILKQSEFLLLRKIENMLMYITLFNQNIFLAGKQRNCSVSGLVWCWCCILLLCCRNVHLLRDCNTSTK